MNPLTLSSDLSPADWIVESLTTFAESVESFVPSGFEAYVRIFHPARLHGRPVAWADIAAANGRVAHAEMQLDALTGLDDRDPQPGVFDESPEEGSLPEGVREPVIAVLGRHTTTPRQCWFAHWNGWGGLRERLGDPPAFPTPNREYFLFAGPIEAIALDMTGVWSQSANIWWPDDHAWCVATEIDLRTTYVGCSEACSGDLLARPELEAYVIDPSTGIYDLRNSGTK